MSIFKGTKVDGKLGKKIINNKEMYYLKFIYAFESLSRTIPLKAIYINVHVRYNGILCLYDCNAGTLFAALLMQVSIWCALK